MTENEFSSIGIIKRALTIAKKAGVGCELSRFDVIELAGFIADMEQTYDEDRIRIAELENENRGLRHIVSSWSEGSGDQQLKNELQKLRVKNSELERFAFWVWNVYSCNVEDLILDIMGATTYDTEGEAKDGKYALPKHCFDLMKRIDEYTEHIYDGTYLDVEISTDAKKGIPENKPAYNENANSLLRSAWMIANRNGEQTNWEAFKNAVYKELVVEHNAKTSTDNNKCMWVMVEDPDIDLWCTSCGEEFHLEADTPSDNHMKYCCYCGKEIAEDTNGSKPV